MRSCGDGLHDDPRLRPRPSRRAHPARGSRAGSAWSRRGARPDGVGRRLPLGPPRPRRRMGARGPDRARPRGIGRDRGARRRRGRSLSRAAASGSLVALSWLIPCGALPLVPGRPRLVVLEQPVLHPPDAGRPVPPPIAADGSDVLTYCAIGTFADRQNVPAAAAIPVPDGTPPEVAALIGCCVTTGVGAATKTAEVPARLVRRGHRPRRGRPVVRHGGSDRRGRPDRRR